MLRGSNRPVIGSVMVYASCVTHLSPKRGSGMIGVVRARAAAALCGGARRRVRVLAVLGFDQGAKEAVRVREANAKGNRTCAVLCSKVRHGGAVACVVERRRRVMPGHLGCATAKK